MTSIGDFLSLGTNLVVLGLIVAGVMKIFQMAAHLEELKEILKDIRRGANVIAPSAHTPEARTNLPFAPPAVPAQPYSPSPYAESSYPPMTGVGALAAAVPQPEGANPPVPGPAPASSEPLSVGPGMTFSRPPTPEELVRAIHAQDFKGDDFPL